MQKVKNVFQKVWIKIKGWSLSKKIIYGLILILVIFLVYGIFKPKDNSANITTDIAKVINLKQTVLATGQVTSNTDLKLSFFSSGIVRKVNVKVGDNVKAGQILASLDQGNEYAALTQARGAVAAAEARYQSILDGASNEEINLAQIALDNAKSAAKDAYNALLSNNLIAIPNNSISSGTITAPIISGTYKGGEEGSYLITVVPGSSPYFTTSGIESFTGSVSTSNTTPLGTKGLFIQFPTDINNYSYIQWLVSIPNTKSPTYISLYNAYQTALNLVQQQQAALALKKANARPADIDLAKANIMTAEGQLQAASANFEHTILRAPSDGTITNVDIKIGELNQALKNVMSLQDIKSVYLEADINEANVTSIKVGAPVDITFDAFGTEKVFKGSVLKIDPSSTIISGVVNYKITASVVETPELRPGMTANMTILTAEKDNVLVIPTRAILKDKSGKQTVRLVTDSKRKFYKEVEIKTGLEGDGGLDEVISGLNAGDEIVVLIKK